MTTTTGGLKRQDIAALVVVADPHPTMGHGLLLDHIDLKWILRDRGCASVSSEPSASVPRKDPREVLLSTHPPEMPGHEIHVSGERNSPRSGERQNNDVHHHDATVMNSTATSSTFSMAPDSDNGGSATSSQPRRRRGGRNLLTLDPHMVCSCSNDKKGILLDSPRSVFLVLSNGHSVASLCRADQQEFYNEALRTGVPLDMVNLRIEAENKRRLQRYHSIRSAYVEMCTKISSDALVDAIRDQKYGIKVEAAKNRQRMKSVPRFAYYGGEDLGLIDEDCQRLLEHTRNKTVDEVRRVLEQNEKKMHQQNERERNADQDMSAIEAERRAVEMKEKDRRERSRAIQRRSDEFRQRVQRIRQEQEEEQEDLRRRVEVKIQENEEFQEHQEMMRRHLSMSSAVSNDQKRSLVKQSVAEREEQRRQELIHRSEYMAQLHRREQDRKREKKAEESRAMKESLEEKGRTTRMLAAMQLEERRMKSEYAIAQSNERAEQFKKTRALRLEARKQLLEERKERGAQARRLAEEKRARKAAELELDYERKQKYIADMNEETEREMTLQKELSKQSRMVQLEEQNRCRHVKSFQSIGYHADTQAKEEWLERENEKRRLLALQVRQERDALYRARDMILQQVEEGEVLRKKQETFAKANSGQQHVSQMRTRAPLPPVRRSSNDESEPPQAGGATSPSGGAAVSSSSVGDLPTGSPSCCAPDGDDHRVEAT